MEKRDGIDAKNQAQSVIYRTEKQLKELSDKVPGDVKTKVESKLQEVKNAVAASSTQKQCLKYRARAFSSWCL